jgi:hypothetical protein
VLHVEALPMSDPSAPQMTDLRDMTEVDILMPEIMAEATLPPPPALIARTHGSGRIESVDGSETGQEDAAEEDSDHAAEVEMELEVEAMFSDPRPKPSAPPAIRQLTPNLPEEDGSSMFYIDTEPDLNASTSAPVYTTTSSATLGTARSRKISGKSDEEQIVFAPKTYKQPKPISIAVTSKPSQPAPIVDLSGDILQDRDIERATTSRRDKKAAKREKRKGNKKKNGKGKGRKGGAMDVDSEIEWGSDGPPPKVMAVQGEREDYDVAILRDYLAGTLLNAKIEAEEEEEERLERAAAREKKGLQPESEEEDEDEDDEVDLEAMRTFGESVNGVLGEIQDGDEEENAPVEGVIEMVMEEDEEEGDWESSSGEDLTDVDMDEEVKSYKKGKGKGNTKGKEKSIVSSALTSLAGPLLTISSSLLLPRKEKAEHQLRLAASMIQKDGCKAICQSPIPTSIRRTTRTIRLLLAVSRK